MYVVERLRSGDVAVDLDFIFRALSGQRLYAKPDQFQLKVAMAARDAAVSAALATLPASSKLWVVASGATKRDRERDRPNVSAVRMTLICPSREDCITRIRGDERRCETSMAEWVKWVDRWFKRAEGVSQ